MRKIALVLAIVIALAVMLPTTLAIILPATLAEEIQILSGYCWHCKRTTVWISDRECSECGKDPAGRGR